MVIAGHLERSGGIPPVEGGISSGALWRIGRVLVAPLTDKSITTTVKIRASYFKVAPCGG